MKRRPCLALPALLGLGPAPTLAAPAGELHGLTENLAPLNYQGARGPQGFSVELLRRLAADTAQSLVLDVLPWQRAVQQAAGDPASVLFSLTRTPEREAQYRWVGPITPRRILVYKLARRRGLTLERLADLGDARIGAVRDSATDRQLQAAGLRPGEQIEHGRDDATNVRKLLAGRMAFVALLDWAAAFHLRELGLPYATLEPVMALDTGAAYWYGLHRAADPRLVRRLQAALDAFKRDGGYERLRQRYFQA